MKQITDNDLPFFKEQAHNLIKEVNLILRNRISITNPPLALFTVSDLASHILSICMSVYKETTHQSEHQNMESLISAILRDAKAKHIEYLKFKKEATH